MSNTAAELFTDDIMAMLLERLSIAITDYGNGHLVLQLQDVVSGQASPNQVSIDTVMQTKPLNVGGRTESVLHTVRLFSPDQ